MTEDVGDFDPSGTSGHAVPPHLSEESGENRSETTDLTQFSNGVSNLSLETTSSNEADYSKNAVLVDIEGASIKEKGLRLLELFPNETEIHVTYILEKVNGDFTQAMDVLLNYSFFNHEHVDGEGKVNTKGIDGFFEGNGHASGKKKKGKSRKYHSSTEVYDFVPDPSSQGNKWRNATADIDFIALHCNVPYKIVNSTYHKSGATLPKAISALLDAELDTTNTPTRVLQQEPGVASFADEFPNIPVRYIAALLRITTPSTANAHQLAKALISNPLSGATGSLQPLKIVPQYAAYREESTTPTTRTPKSSIPSSPVIGSASSLSSARGEAFNKAHQYYRKGKSDHLMGGAAAYYSQQGRDLSTALHASSAAEADALVAAQSTPTSIDLHGVTVKDATRIANERVTTWWHNLGEGRLQHGDKYAAGGGFRIIVGVGRHTEGGVGKLGPAVARMLVREGWKVEVGSGALVVRGVARKK